MLPPAVAIAGMVATVAIVAPVRAAVLNNWNFDAATRQLTVTLPNGITPDFFLLAQPARIVLDIPNATLGNVSQLQQYSGAVRSIRLSEVSSGSRVVIELAPNTLLDPRHAELTSQPAGNGQTQWTLRPLLQDTNPSAIAAAPPAASSAPPSTPTVSSASQSSVPTPAAAAPAPAVGPSAAEPAPAPAAEVTDASPPPIAEPTSSNIPPAPTATASEAASTVSPSAVPIPETQAAGPGLPDMVHSATTGAALALPRGVESLQGIRTDAAALEGVGEDNLSDLPPEQMPIDPFAPSVPSTVTVPSLAETDSTPAPVVSVPDIAEVPDAPAIASPPPAAPTPTAAPPPAAPPTPIATAPDQAIAATPMDVPAVPLPPDNWSDRANADLPPNQVRPPQAAIAPADPAPVAAPPPSPGTARQPGQAVAAAADQADRTVPPPSQPVAPPSQSTVPPPPAAARPNSAGSNSPATIPPPPFLESSGPPPAIEQPSIPPPPPLPQEDGTVPFGAPLPQTKALADEAADDRYSPQSVIPVGTRMTLRYSGREPLVLAETAPIYDVLTLAEHIYGPDGDLLLPAGAQVQGRFEGFDDSGRRFVSQAIVYDGDRLPVLAESDWLLGTPQPRGVNLALGSGIGAAAVTLLSGLTGFGIVGGAAAGAVAAALESPRLVTIEPGQMIQVEVVSEVLPFNDAPESTQPY